MPHDDRIPTGISGLDDILGGGLPPSRFYLVQGDPGVGKTTLGLQFILEGMRRGESVLYVSLSETREELKAVASSHGWDVSRLPMFELAAAGDQLMLERQNTLFEPSEVELAEVTRALLGEVERVRPTRLVFDSLSEMRLLAQSSLRYRRQLLALKQYFTGRGCTVLLMDDRTSEGGDVQLQSLAHGVVVLEQLALVYGGDRRRLRVAKLRGVAFRGGYHDFRIVKGGIEIFPRLVAAEHRERFAPGAVPSGIRGLDELLGGGLERGTSVLFMGPAGCGKSLLAAHYAFASADRGEPAIIYAFDEARETALARARGIGMPLDQAIEAGKLRLQQLDPAEVSPGEFVHLIRTEVESRGARIVVVDSLNGYLAAMPEEKFLIVQMHELLTYLRQRGVLAILVVAQAGLIGHMTAPVDMSYLADTVVLLRFFEAHGVVRKAISVLKRRTGAHGTEIRELQMDRTGVRVGDQLKNLQGVLTGVPRFEVEP
jgi:circadian clock protein KaiC